MTEGYDPIVTHGRVPLPERYGDSWREPFEGAARDRMTARSSVLDIGSGRRPSFPPHDRPAGIEYVGLDVSREELEAAGPGAYTETIAADASEMRAELVGRFDLAVSWQVLEHVRDLGATVENVRHYLKPGGRFVALFSGSWSAFGVVNRILPDRIGHPLVSRLMNREQQGQPVFPSYYDRCHASALERVFGLWPRYELTPLYQGALYFGFSKSLQRTYLAYENWIERRQVANLATHYLVKATR